MKEHDLTIVTLMNDLISDTCKNSTDSIHHYLSIQLMSPLDGFFVVFSFDVHYLFDC